MIDSFVLDTNSDLQKVNSLSRQLVWGYASTCLDNRYSLILNVGENIILPEIKISKDSLLLIRFTGISNDTQSNIECKINFTGSRDFNIANFSFIPSLQSNEWNLVSLDLSFLKGQEGRISLTSNLSGENQQSENHSLAISELCIAPSDKLSLVRASSFNALRSENEIQHFSQTYKHSFYNSQENSKGDEEKAERIVRKLYQNNDLIYAKSNESKFEELDPLPGENSYNFAHRLMSNIIPQVPPNFHNRLYQKSKESRGKVKVLSLCSGAARIESDFAIHAGENVEWSLLDINSDLLQSASEKFPSNIKVDLIEADVNKLTYTDEKWDIILCVSGIHHIIELESLASFCHNSLLDDGELWMIGEYIGRNGSQLWPKEREVANSIFSILPEKYRLNAHTNQADEFLPENDCSVGCFEGIRSEEIEGIFEKWFNPLDVYKRSCFLWRIMNLAYCENYDPANEIDREWIYKIVKSEINHFRNGGKTTELHGVFTPKKII